jgi:hypothetical protein
LFDFRSEYLQATLFLCPDCLESRYYGKTDGFIMAGLAILVSAVFTGFLNLAFGLLFGIAGIFLTAWGLWKKTVKIELTEQTINDFRRIEEERRNKPEPSTSELYHSLLSDYAIKWGSRIGIHMLSNDIDAYMRQGASYPEAIRSVYHRHRSQGF